MSNEVFVAKKSAVSAIEQWMQFVFDGVIEKQLMNLGDSHDRISDFDKVYDYGWFAAENADNSPDSSVSHWILCQVISYPEDIISSTVAGVATQIAINPENGNVNTRVGMLPFGPTTDDNPPTWGTWQGGDVVEVIADSSNSTAYPFSNYATNLDSLGVHPATPSLYKVIRKGNRIFGLVQYVASAANQLKFSDTLGERASPKGKMRVFSIKTKYRPASEFANIEQPITGSTRINDTYTLNSNFEEHPCAGYISQTGLCIAYCDHTEALYDLTIRFSYDL